MSIPTNSIGPTPPVGTSNPVKVEGWFTQIIDWIRGLSPSGSTVYDTGLIPIPAGTGFVSNAFVRRVGKTISVTGDFRPLAAGTITTGAFLNLGKLPPGFFVVMNLPLYANVAAPVQGRILADGTIQAILMAGQASQNTSTTTSFSLAYAGWIMP